ncbi:hypothetical protein BJF78_03860 [Pseudonocardia sp. CNS-139]|nr:hypothetical protein BJF78_03860 [Pseudonocardia sp. CNS-139]
MNPTTPCFDAEYGAACTTPCLPPVDAMLITRPLPFASIPPSFSTVFVTRKTLFRFVSITSYQRSSAISAVAPPPGRPALLTRTSTGPYRSTAAPTNCRTCSGDVTSHGCPSAVSPSFCRSLTVASTVSALRAQRKTRFPLRARDRAISRPIPLVAPVTIARARAPCSFPPAVGVPPLSATSPRFGQAPRAPLASAWWRRPRF